MRLRYVILMCAMVVLTFGPACSGPQEKRGEEVAMKPDTPPPSEPREQSTSDDEEAAGASDMDASAEEEALSVEMFQLEPGEPYQTSGGLEFSISESEGNDEQKPEVDILVERGDEQETFTLSRETPYAEVAFFGRVFTLQLGPESTQVTHRSNASAEPLTQEAAVEIASDEAAKRLGCGETVEGQSVTTGNVLIVDFGGDCSVTVGLYTGDVIDR